VLVRGDRCEVAAISASTISRELARNRIHGVYSAQVAQMRTEQRRRERPLVRKMDRPEIRDAVQDGLIQPWSPDQISGRQRQQFAEQPQRHVSASTVYRWIQQQGAQRKHWQQ
jgi:IS30 family transposase